MRTTCIRRFRMKKKPMTWDLWKINRRLRKMLAECRDMANRATALFAIVSRAEKGNQP